MHRLKKVNTLIEEADGIKETGYVFKLCCLPSTCQYTACSYIQQNIYTRVRQLICQNAIVGNIKSAESQNVRGLEL